MKVYVITCGAHSDYRICAVAIDPKKAEELKRRFDLADYTGANIEEWDTDDARIDLSQSQDIYEVHFDGQGNCVRITNKTADNISRQGRYYTDEDLKEKIYYNDGNKHSYVSVFAYEAESAVKIATERRAKFLSEMWGDGWSK
jgi:hypothetical protein